MKKRDPKVGRKKPKGSGRTIYRENPRDTVSIKFKQADARATVSKVKINKPYARKIQILTVGEQRAAMAESVAYLKKVKLLKAKR